jgi:hypothetical protein
MRSALVSLGSCGDFASRLSSPTRRLRAKLLHLRLGPPQHPRSEVPFAYPSAPASLGREEIGQIASEGIRKEGNRSKRNVAPFSILRIPCRVIFARLASSLRDIRAAFRRAFSSFTNALSTGQTISAGGVMAYAAFFSATSRSAMISSTDHT